MARKSRGGEAATVMDRINTQMKGEVVTMGSDKKYILTRVPTGVLTIDRLLHGGFARGRHVEVFGDWMVGKSLICYLTLALAQQRGEVCALVDTEGVFNPAWFRQLGGDPNQLILVSAKNASALGNILRLMIQRGEFRQVDIILIDSVAALLPKEEEEHDLEDSLQPARLAALMSVLLRQLTMQNQDTLFIWTNQWRDKISRIPGLQSTPGGRALGFYASTRLEMMQTEKEMEEVETVFKGKKVTRKRTVGRWVQCTARKDKTGARPESQRSFMLNYETKRPDIGREIIDLGMEDGIVERKGDYYEVVGYDSSVRCHGVKRFVNKVEEDDTLREFLVTCIEERTAELMADG